MITEAVPRYTGSGHGPINGRHTRANGGYGEVDVPALSRYDLRGSTALVGWRLIGDPSSIVCGHRFGRRTAPVSHL